MSDVHESEPFNNTEQPLDLNTVLAKVRWLVPSDVDIRIVWAELGPDIRAQCVSDIRNNRLLIKVAHDTGDIDQWGFPLPRDILADVTHELLHWRHELSQPKDKTAAYETWEAAIERTAQDIIRLVRRIDELERGQHV